jgi:predicted esterase
MSGDRSLEPVTLGDLSGLRRRGVGEQRATAVLLHGYGGDEKVMWIFSEALPSSWTVVAFRGLVAAEEGGYRWHDGRRWPPPPAQRFEPAVDALRRAVPEDRNVLWIGFSQGAALALCCAAGRTPLGVACLAGYLPEGLAPLTARLPVFWAHGRRDDKVPITSARAAADVLGSWRVNLDFCEAGSGHKVGAECLRALKGWVGRLEASG